jgi:transcription antitermination protein NusB
MQNEQNQNPLASASNRVDTVARHNARRYVLQAMYQWQIAGTAVSEIEAEFLHYHIDKKLDLTYFKELIHGISHQHHKIDQEMQPFLDRPLHEIDPVELAVLRIATYELIQRLDVPYRVIINEALQLTKMFGSVDGYKFVNGILDRIAKKNRSAEAKTKQRS